MIMCNEIKIEQRYELFYLCLSCNHVYTVDDLLRHYVWDLIYPNYIKVRH